MISGLCVLIDFVNEIRGLWASQVCDIIERMGFFRGAAVVLAVIGGLAGPSGWAQERILYLLDASGSMEQDSRFVRAKTQILNGVDSMEERGGQVGLIVFGGGNCNSVHFRVKPGPGFGPAIREYLQHFLPKGATPLGSGLKMAKKYLEEFPEPKPKLVVLTDGEDNCGEDEKALMLDLQAKGLVKELEYQWLAPPAQWPEGEGPIVDPASIPREMHFGKGPVGKPSGQPSLPQPSVPPTTPPTVPPVKLPKAPEPQPNPPPDAPEIEHPLL